MNASGAISMMRFSSIFCDFFGVNQIEQRVIKRPQVRIDLVLQIAGQKAQPLAGLDRGTREDNAAHLFFEQCIDGHSDGEKAFTSTRDPNTEDEIVRGYGVEIPSLVGGFWSDRLFA